MGTNQWATLLIHGLQQHIICEILRYFRLYVKQELTTSGVENPGQTSVYFSRGLWEDCQTPG